MHPKSGREPVRERIAGLIEGGSDIKVGYDSVGRQYTHIANGPAVADAILALLSRPDGAEPVDMLLHCPACGLQHIDAPSEPRQVPTYSMPANVVIGYTTTVDWTNPPHRSHLCHGCGHIWRPSDTATNGVAAIQTVGKHDSPIAHPLPDEGWRAPEGWKLVPIEPTEAMIVKGSMADADEATGIIWEHNVYRAMLAAAPLPDPPKPEGEA